jgi:hypothetical protein
MSRIEEALVAIESLDEGEHFTYINTANTYSVSRVTLARRHQGIQASRTDQAVKQRILNLQQELELVKYITRLTEDVLPPIRNMIQSFASEIIEGRWEISGLLALFTEMKRILLLSRPLG